MIILFHPSGYIQKDVGESHYQKKEIPVASSVEQLKGKLDAKYPWISWVVLGYGTNIYFLCTISIIFLLITHFKGTSGTKRYEKAGKWHGLPGAYFNNPKPDTRKVLVAVPIEKPSPGCKAKANSKNKFAGLIKKHVVCTQTSHFQRKLP